MNGSPSSATYSPSTSHTIALTAEPNGLDQNVVVIRLQAANMTITDYEPPTSGWTVTTADCSGSVYFTTTLVCVTLGKTTDIIDGESLGTVSFTVGSSGTSTLTKITDNSYTDGVTVIEDEGLLASYVISSDLPATSIQITNTASVGIFIILIGLGIAFYDKFLLRRNISES